MTDVDGHPPEQHTGRRRQSLMPRDMEGLTSNPNMRRTSRLDVGRPSVQYGLSGRRMSQFSRSSISGASLGRGYNAPVQYANTYRMEPSEGTKFQSKKAEEVISSVLSSYLGGEKYNPENCANFVQQLADVIKKQMKQQGFSDRYKFVCVVTIGQNKNQGISIVSRSVWSPDTDSFATASYSSGDLFASAYIFASYYE